MPSRSILRAILIFTFQLCQGFQCGLFPSGFPTKILYEIFASSIRAIYLTPPHPPWFDDHNHIWRRLQIMKVPKLPITQFYPVPYYLLSLSYKYSSPHPVLAGTLCVGYGVLHGTYRCYSPPLGTQNVNNWDTVNAKGCNTKYCPVSRIAAALLQLKHSRQLYTLSEYIISWSSFQSIWL
jgi:hypothetical protein